MFINKIRINKLGFTSTGLAAFVGYESEPARQRTAIALCEVGST